MDTPSTEPTRVDGSPDDTQPRDRWTDEPLREEASISEPRARSTPPGEGPPPGDPPPPGDLPPPADGPPGPRDYPEPQRPRDERRATGIAIALLVLVGLVLGSLGVARVAADALPGDTLYPVKTDVEQARVSLTSDPARRADLNLEYAALRLDEIRSLISMRRTDEIPRAVREYEGYIQGALETADGLAEREPARATAINRRINASLAQYGDTLAALSTAVPEPERAPLDRAIGYSSATRNYSHRFVYRGTVDQIGTTQWVIDGHVFHLTEASHTRSNIRLNDPVEVEAWADSEGTYYLRDIRVARTQPNVRSRAGRGLLFGDDEGEFEWLGTVESMAPDQWVIDGEPLYVDTNTRVEDLIVVGDRVRVEAWRHADGRYFIREIEPVSAWSAGDDDRNEDDDDRFDDDRRDDRDDDLGEEDAEFEGTLERITNEAWTVGGREFYLTPRTEFDDDVQVGDYVQVEASLGEDGRWYLEEIKRAGPDDRDDDDAFRDGRLEFRGVVEEIAETYWVVRGRVLYTLYLAEHTKIEDDLAVGDVVKVEAYAGTEDRLYLDEIARYDDDDWNDDDWDDDDSRGLGPPDEVPGLGDERRADPPGRDDD